MFHGAVRKLIRRREGNVAMIVAGGLAMLTGTAVRGGDPATL